MEPGPPFSRNSLIGGGLLTLMGRITTLPLAVTPGMVLSVLAGTLVFSILSGAIATRRLAGADPADLF